MQEEASTERSDSHETPVLTSTIYWSLFLAAYSTSTVLVLFVTLTYALLKRSTYLIHEEPFPTF